MCHVEELELRTTSPKGLLDQNAGHEAEIERLSEEREKLGAELQSVRRDEAALQEPAHDIRARVHHRVRLAFRASFVCVRRPRRWSGSAAVFR